MILSVSDKPPEWAAYLFNKGEEFIKTAEASPELTYNLFGTLYLSKTGFLLLTVPNPFVRGLFSAMNEPGIELPPSPNGQLEAHITVMTPNDVALAGGPDAISERGKQFKYTLGRIYTVEPDGWEDIAKVWYVRVHSQDLQTLRRSYGLTSMPHGDRDFHITIAVRRKRVLGRNTTSKST